MGDIFGGDSTTTSKTILPKHLTDAGKEAMTIAKGAADQPYTPYPGRRVAGLYPGFDTAAKIAREESSRNRPGFDTAGAMYQGAMGYGKSNPYLDSLWGGKGISTDAWGKSAMDQYMSPYIEGALDPVAREIRRNSEIMGRRDEDAFKSAGAFGGEREAIMAAERERGTRESISDLYGQGYHNAYQSALGAFNTDQTRNLQAQGMSADASVGMFDRGLDAGHMYGVNEGMRGDIASGDIERLIRSGVPIQEHAQMGADEEYRQWLEKREWPSRALDYYLKAAGMPHEMTQENTQPGASPFSQLVGTGLAVGGLAGGLGWAPLAGTIGGATQRNPQAPQAPVRGGFSAGLSPGLQNLVATPATNRRTYP